MRNSFRYGAAAALLALCCLRADPASAAQRPKPSPTPETIAPTVVDVALHAVAPGRASDPRGELQHRTFGPRTFYTSFVFHISGEASGFPKAVSVDYACGVFDAGRAEIGSGKAHADLNADGTSYPVTDDIVGVQVDDNQRSAPGNTWTCTMAVVDAGGKPMPVDPARSVVEADGPIAPR